MLLDGICKALAVVVVLCLIIAVCIGIELGWFLFQKLGGAI